MCALHKRVHHLDKVLIATAFFVCVLRNCSALFEIRTGSLLYVNISVPLQHYELVSARLDRKALRGSLWRKREICSLISSYTHFHRTSQKYMNDLLDFSVHFYLVSHEYVSFTQRIV